MSGQLLIKRQSLSLSTRLGTCVSDIILLEDKTREILFHNEKLHLMAALVPHTLPDPSQTLPAFPVAVGYGSPVIGI